MKSPSYACHPGVSNKRMNSDYALRYERWLMLSDDGQQCFYAQRASPLASWEPAVLACLFELRAFQLQVSSLYQSHPCSWEIWRLLSLLLRSRARS